MRYLAAILVVLSFSLASRAEEKTEELFNGRDLSGWDADPRVWRVEDGLLVGRTTPETKLQHNTFAIWTGGEVGDFHLEVVARLTGDNNSGVQYRSQRNPKNGKHSIVGYQADLHAAPNYTGMLYDEGGRGIAAERGQQVILGPENAKEVQPLEVKLQPVKLDDWTTLEVIAQGNRLVHKINGEVTVDVTDNDPENAEARGLLALQVHAGPPMKVEFKSVKLKRLDGASAGR